ncbi:Beta-mannosidase [Candidatus Sulfopaludibacter sp. SbA3]|nr:Beta-mannosidase [Candidatus Sulfopaludibacter sp. SbA3]
MRHTVLFLLSSLFALQAQPYTRGVGVYPGDPKEDFAPSLVPDIQTYRNLALHRAAYQSSSYDFYHTAQLVTDGIKDTKLPRWFSIATSDRGTLSRQEREHPVDHNTTTRVNSTGTPPWIQVETGGGDAPFEVDRVEVTGGGRGATGGTMVVSGSDDGQSWKELGRGTAPPPAAPPAGGRGFGFGFAPTPVPVKFPEPAHTRFYRVAYEGGAGTQWGVSELAFFRNNERVEVGGPYHFTSAWKPAGTGQEWVYVDLGAACTFDRVVLHWIRRAAEGSIQVSDDAKTWRTLQDLSTVDDIKLPQPARGRYVRVLLTKPATPDGYILSELEVYGRGGPVARPHAAPLADANGRLQLSGGAWRLQRDSLVTADGPTLSRPGFADKDWIVATVPATVLSSYWNVGAIPDPNYGDNINTISDSFFYADFWYRDEFVAPPLSAGRHAWLHLRGINWKADVYLNGELLGPVEGGFIRGLFDVTKVLKPGVKNAVAIRIHKNATPGSAKEKTWESPDLNGGALGADNPTYHATAGWDWIPSVRGRDIGIWSDIYLDSSGPVTIENPFVNTTLPLPDTSRAEVTIEARLRNSGTAPINGTLHGRFGDVPFDLPVTLAPSAAKSFKHAIHLTNPKLWWPAGYGDPNLYKVQLTFETADKKVSDAKTFQTGVRQFTYSEENSALKIFINGRRFIGRGGNWGFPEVNLRYRAREYDVAVRYHKDMNFTMIRNWVGQTGDDEFFDACDKYGIVVWEDFWLANPVDGPNPNDNDLFLKNSEDFILRIRNHPSIGLYCGRNEGPPPQPINDGLKAQIDALHPGMHYIPSSSQGTVSGGGPYRTVPPKQYFQTRATPKLHSELGMPNVVTLDSLKQMMPEEAMWPQGDVWGIHDFTRTGAQGGTAWMDMIDKNYGGAANAADWVELSQFIDYDGYRAIFEAQSKNRMGVLLWMSHPCWPSFVWQTYDYYFDTSAGYFGSKKGSEPLHIQWNPLGDAVEVVNYSAGNVQGLTAHAEVLNMNGFLKWEKSVTVNSKEDSVEAPITIEFPSDLTPVHFIRLKLTRGTQVMSDNFYLHSLEETPALGYNLKAIRSLPKVKVEAASRIAQQSGRWMITTELHNTADQPALLVRVKAVREKSGDRILPALSSDNYIALMPGERRTIRTNWKTPTPAESAPAW